MGLPAWLPAINIMHSLCRRAWNVIKNFYGEYGQLHQLKAAGELWRVGNPAIDPFQTQGL